LFGRDHDRLYRLTASIESSSLSDGLSPPSPESSEAFFRSFQKLRPALESDSVCSARSGNERSLPSTQSTQLEQTSAATRTQTCASRWKRGQAACRRGSRL